MKHRVNRTVIFAALIGLCGQNLSSFANPVDYTSGNKASDESVQVMDGQQTVDKSQDQIPRVRESCESAGFLWRTNSDPEINGCYAKPWWRLEPKPCRAGEKDCLACTDTGGLWAPDGMAQRLICHKVFLDGNKLCVNSDQGSPNESAFLVR